MCSCSLIYHKKDNICHKNSKKLPFILRKNGATIISESRNATSTRKTQDIEKEIDLRACVALF